MFLRKTSSEVFKVKKIKIITFNFVFKNEALFSFFVEDSQPELVN